MLSLPLKSALAAAIAAAAVFPAAASANRFCVDLTCNDGPSFSSVQAALDAAAAHPGLDTVDIGKRKGGGDHIGGFGYIASGADNDVRIRGVDLAGSKPGLAAFGSGAVLAVQGAGSSVVENLTLKAGSDASSTGLDLSGGRAADISVTGQAGTGAKLTGSILERSSVFMSGGTGVRVTGAPSTISASAVGGDTALEEFFGQVRVDRSSLRGGSAGILATGDRSGAAHAIHLTSTIVSTSAPASTGIALTDVRSARIARSTVVGVSPAPAASSTAIASTAIGAETAVQLVGSVLDGYPRGLKRAVANGHHTGMSLTRSEWDPSHDALGGAAAGPVTDAENVHADPKLIDPAKDDSRLRGDDKAIDLLGDPGGEAPSDLAGIGTIDGDGDGTAKADAGALEYRRQAPVLTAVSLPTFTSDDFDTTFAVKASDPDGDPVTVDWGFGDGGTAQGETVKHRFAAVGSFAVTATAHDVAGRTTNQKVTVLVGTKAAPEPTPDPAPGDPAPDGTPAAAPAPGPAPGTAPAADRTAPVLTTAKLSARRVRAAKARKVLLRLRSSEAAKATIVLDGRRTTALPLGTATAKLRVARKLGRLRPGRHVLRIVATDAAGNRSAARKLVLKVRR